MYLLPLFSSAKKKNRKYIEEKYFIQPEKIFRGTKTDKEIHIYKIFWILSDMDKNKLISYLFSLFVRNNLKKILRSDWNLARMVVKQLSNLKMVKVGSNNIEFERNKAVEVGEMCLKTNVKSPSYVHWSTLIVINFASSQTLYISFVQLSVKSYSFPSISYHNW